MTDVTYTITVERNDEAPPMFRYRGKLRNGSALIDMTHQCTREAVERVLRHIRRNTLPARRSRSLT